MGDVELSHPVDTSGVATDEAAATPTRAKKDKKHKKKDLLDLNGSARGETPKSSNGNRNSHRDRLDTPRSSHRGEKIHKSKKHSPKEKNVSHRKSGQGAGGVIKELKKQKSDEKGNNNKEQKSKKLKKIGSKASL